MTAFILKYATVLFCIVIGVWFATAQPHFDRSSPRRPLLMLVMGLSMALSVSTIILALSRDVPLDRLVVTFLVAMAAALLFGWALAAIARKNLGLAFSGIVPNQVVAAGPYRYVRHPLYTAYALFWFSCAYLSGSGIVGALAAVIALLYVVAARAEERDIMRSHLAEAYNLYRQNTGLVVPRFRQRAVGS